MEEYPKFIRPFEYCSCLKTETKLLLDEVLTKYIELMESHIIEIEEELKKPVETTSGLSGLMIRQIPNETLELLNEMKENVRRARISKIKAERTMECAF